MARGGNNNGHRGLFDENSKAICFHQNLKFMKFIACWDLFFKILKSSKAVKKLFFCNQKKGKFNFTNAHSLKSQRQHRNFCD
jgi:hypothetical protein